MTPICEQLHGQMGGLFMCEPKGHFIRIRTPFLYPDGDYIDLFVKRGQDPITITDLGETARWLRMQTISPRRTVKQKQMMQDICLTHGVEFFKGMLEVRCQSAENLAATVMRLSQAALRIADIWLTYRSRVYESVMDEVAAFLEEKAISFERGENVVGRSGRSYHVDFHTRTPRRSALVSVLSTGSKSAARGIVDHVVTTWFDLNHLQIGPEALSFISLFDDTMDVWRDEDFRLVQEVSQIVRWSQPQEFLESIAA
jgi:hypothetical protein